MEARNNEILKVGAGDALPTYPVASILAADGFVKQAIGSLQSASGGIVGAGPTANPKAIQSLPKLGERQIQYLEDATAYIQTPEGAKYLSENLGYTAEDYENAVTAMSDWYTLVEDMRILNASVSAGVAVTAANSKALFNAYYREVRTAVQNGDESAVGIYNTISQMYANLFGKRNLPLKAVYSDRYVPRGHGREEMRLRNLGIDPCATDTI